MNKQLDWNATEQKAKQMDERALWYAILDIQKVLPSSDALDRNDNGNRGGYYRDEASVYHREIANRRGK